MVKGVILVVTLFLFEQVILTVPLAYSFTKLKNCIFELTLFFRTKDTPLCFIRSSNRTLMIYTAYSLTIQERVIWNDPHYIVRSLHTDLQFFSYGAAAQRGPWPPHSVGILWTSDQPVAETSTWQQTTLKTDKYPCPPAGFEPTISAGERPQTYSLDRTATGTGIQTVMELFYCINE